MFNEIYFILLQNSKCMNREVYRSIREIGDTVPSENHLELDNWDEMKDIIIHLSPSIMSNISVLKRFMVYYILTPIPTVKIKK